MRIRKAVIAAGIIPPGLEGSGQQFKEQAQLDVRLRDGSAAYGNSLCDWE